MSGAAGAGGAGAGGSGDGGAGGAAPPAGGGAAPPAGTPPAGAPAPDWTAGFQELERGYIQNKGWKGATDLLSSYQNLEKSMGAPPEQLLRLPAKHDDAEGWSKVFERLGRPAKPADYKMEVKDAAFGDWAKGTFHKLGLNATQAEALAKEFNTFSDGIMGKKGEEIAAKVQQEEQALARKWGAAHKQNMELAKLASTKLGIDGDAIDALQSALGYQKTMELMHGLGTKVGEHGFVGGNGPSGGSSIRTPEAAKAHIAALRQDSDFQKRFMAGDTKALSEWGKTHSEAYPGEPVA